MFKKLSLIAMVTALCVVVLGAYVRLSDAGLGCPDWPGCYGTLTVPQSEEAIAQAQTIYPDSSVDVGKAWKEMLHRYLAGGLGLMVLGLFLLSWKNKHTVKVSPILTTGLLALVGFQAMLGMWTVTMLLKPAVVTAHLLGGMSTLAVLTWIAHRYWGMQMTYHNVSKKFGWFVRFALLVLFLQIVLGGWTSTNYAALACTDFPTCHGSMVPDMDFKDAFHIFRELGQNASGGDLTLASITAIQWTHRLGAVITLIILGLLALNGLKYTHLKPLSILLLIAVAFQIALGIANLVLRLPIMLAVGHNFGAALLLIILTVYNSKITPNSNRH